MMIGTAARRMMMAATLLALKATNAGATPMFGCWINSDIYYCYAGCCSSFGGYVSACGCDNDGDGWDMHMFGTTCTGQCEY